MKPFVIFLLILAVLWLAGGIIVAFLHFAAKLLIVALLVLGGIALAKWAHAEHNKP